MMQEVGRLLDERMFSSGFSIDFSVAFSCLSELFCSNSVEVSSMNVKQSVASLLQGRSPQASAGLEGGSDQRGIFSKSTSIAEVWHFHSVC
jgi:hypothetical protein